MKLHLYDSGWIGTDTLTHASLYLGISMFRDTLRPYCIFKKQLDLSGVVYCLEGSNGGLSGWSVYIGGLRHTRFTLSYTRSSRTQKSSGVISISQEGSGQKSE